MGVDACDGASFGGGAWAGSKRARSRVVIGSLVLTLQE